MRSILILFALVAVLGVRACADDATTNEAVATTAPAFGDEKIAAMQLDLKLKAIDVSGLAAPKDWAALDAELDNYLKQYGATPKTVHNIVMLRSLQLRVAKRLAGEDRYDARVMKLAADPQPEVAALTAKLAELKTKPIELKFTAVDGSTVDLASLRGKVVLVDFWATWCGPCVGEVPNVVAAYKKYHDQGFEVVGISLDKDKNALTQFTAQNGMVWPQYFDGQGWKNAISSGYEVRSIPCMWLFDRKGLNVSFKAREDLEAKIQQALAAR